MSTPPTASGESPRSLAEKINRQLEIKFPDGRPPWERVMEDIEQATGARVASLWNLAKGHQVNPTVQTLKALAQYFDVPISYFVDEEPPVGANLVRTLALRAHDLSPEKREELIPGLLALLEHAIQAEADNPPQHTRNPRGTDAHT